MTLLSIITMFKFLHQTDNNHKDLIRQYFEPRFQVYYDAYFKGWGIMYQTDKTMGEDWLVLNKDGGLKGYFTSEHEKHYYPSEKLATKAMKEFIVQRCIEEYEYLLRKDLLYNKD